MIHFLTKFKNQPRQQNRNDGEEENDGIFKWCQNKIRYGGILKNIDAPAQIVGVTKNHSYYNQNQIRKCQGQGWFTQNKPEDFCW